MMKKLLILAFILITTPACAGSLLPYPNFKAIDDNGHPIRGGLLYAYEAGTNTAKDMYSDNECTTPTANPLVLNNNGEATVYLCGKYKLNLKTAAGGQVSGWPVDDVEGMNPTPELGVSLDDIYSCDLGAAITAIGATETTLSIDCDVIINDGDSITVPATTMLNFSLGNTIDGMPGGSTETLTINGVIQAGQYQIFGNNLKVTGSPLVDKVNVYWFGAKGDGTTDSVAAIQAAIELNLPVFLPSGTYICSTSLYPTTTTSISGASARTTMLKFTSDSHGIVFGGTYRNDRRKKVFSDFTLISEVGVSNAKYAFYFNGTNAAVRSTVYAIGYTFRDIEINTDTGQFAGGFRLKDTFRLKIDNVGATGLAIALNIVGQCVETSVNGFISNGDSTNEQFGSDDVNNIGVLQETSKDYFGGALNTAEGLYITNSSFVAHKQGFYGGALNCVITGNEFDLFRGGIGVQLVPQGGGSNFIFRDNWISPYDGNSSHAFVSGTAGGVVGILHIAGSSNDEAILIDGNTVYAAGDLPNGGQGISIGYSGNSPFTASKGVIVTNNLIKSNIASGYQWTNGINLDRAKNVVVTGNEVYGTSASGSSASNAAINATYQDYAVIKDNNCPSGIIIFSCLTAKGYGSVSNNRCSTFTNNSTSPYVPTQWDLTKNAGEGLILVAEKITSSGGSTAVIAATPITLFTLPDTAGTYIISRWVEGEGTDYLTTALAIYDGTTLVLSNIKAGASTVLSVSGLRVQDTSAGTKKLTWAYVKIA